MNTYNKTGLTVRKLTDLFLLLLTVSSILVFTSCRQEKKLRIGVSQCNTDDWRSKMNDEILLELYQHPDVEAEILSGEDDNAKQIADIEHFIESGVDALIVSPREAEEVTPVITRAYEKGIPVVVFDRKTTNDRYTTYYGADDRQIGESAAHYIAAHLPSRFTASAPAKVLELRGLDGSSPAQGRHEGFEKTISLYPQLEPAASVAADWSDTKARAAADSLLRQMPDIEVIYAHNDRMALIAREVADSLGKKDIMVVGVDGAPAIGLPGVETGKLNATFIYPTQGAEILRAAIAAAKGEELVKNHIFPTALAIDSTNIGLQLNSALALDESVESIRSLNSRLININHTRDLMDVIFWVLTVALILAALALFLLLRLHWQKKRAQQMLADRNVILEQQRDNLESLNAQLKDATNAKLAFFTNVSHDLRTPLSLISTPVESLENAPNLTPQQKTLLEVAGKNVHILRRLINQILDFQKYDSGKLTLDATALDMRECLRDWVEAFKPAARKKDVKLIFRAQPDSPALTMADREKIERVFFNLMSNAFRFTPPNGEITVTLDTRDAETIRFSVADTGKGIPAENIPHLFERFFQGREGNAGGSGIGLVVVKSFVELHGGEVSVESEPDRGTVFTVSFPRVIPPEEALTESGEIARSAEDAKNTVSTTSKEILSEIAPVEAVAEDTENDSRPMVMVIDDNEDIRVMLRTILGTDYQVLSAPSGEAGIRMTTRYVPDCVICDVMMPGIDGLEVTRRLKSETITSHIPVMLLTACALDHQRAEGYESGADGYLSKPFSPDVLRARIKSLIDNRQRLKSLSSGVADIPVAAPKQDGGASEKDSSQGDEKKEGRRKQMGKTGVDPFSELDSTFYRNFVEMINRDMADSSLNVEEMASRMGMSRVQFYRKLKALTNYSPADLLRLIRLRKAKELLATEDCTVAEVAYKVGFSSPSYFAKCFKDQFGELPSELQGRTSKIS